MPIIVKPKIGRSGSTGLNASGELPYVIIGTNDLIEAKAALATESPTTFDGNPRSDISVEEQYEKSASDGIWDGFARYRSNETVVFAVGDSSYSFNTGGGTQHVTQAKGITYQYPQAGFTAIDFKGAIGVDQDGSVQGADIIVPIFEFEETRVFAAASVTNTYKGILFALTGKVNNAAFKGCKANECLFLGASGGQQGNGDYHITFRFAASLNATGLSVGDITGIDKKGWDYLWIYYREREDTTAKAIVPVPQQAMVAEVYELGNFSLLGIGTT